MRARFSRLEADGRFLVLEVSEAHLNSPGSEPLDTVFPAVQKLGAEGVVLMFDGVTHLSSLNLGTLLNFRRSLLADGRTLSLTGLSGDLRGEFDVTRLSTVFAIHATAELAIAPNPAESAAEPG